MTNVVGAMTIYGVLAIVVISILTPSWGKVVSQRERDYTTPTPILKQINKHNEDGSYSYGYEGADGTYKIETKYPNGEVYGKYGYYDDRGTLREIEYGATRRGFEPAGSEINVPPPTLDQNPKASKPLGPNEEDDGQYREDPRVYENEKYSNDPLPQTYNQPQSNWYQKDNRANQATRQDDDFDNFIFNYQPTTTARPYNPPPPPPQPITNYNHVTYNPPPPAYNPPRPVYNNPPPPQPVYNNPPPPQPVYNPPPTQPAYNPHYNNYYPQNPYVANIDYYTGSYSVNYR